MLGKIIHEYSNFTFQSGSIQMPLACQSLTFQPSFTFQSGSIQIILCDGLLLPKYTLHSNLVLFKWIIDISVSSENVTLHSNLVLFKCKIIPIITPETILYIPIWFYSNDDSKFVIIERATPLHSNLVLFKYL